MFAGYHFASIDAAWLSSIEQYTSNKLFPLLKGEAGFFRFITAKEPVAWFSSAISKLMIFLWRYSQVRVSHTFLYHRPLVT